MTPARSPSGNSVAKPDDGLRVDHLSMRFGGVRVFDDITFRLGPGDLLGVIGPNGAGKTTLINLICGRLSPSGGRVFLRGLDITGQPSYKISRLGLARSFQQTNIFRKATVRENIARARLFSGRPDGGDAQLDAMLHEFGLVGRLDELGNSLPYGLQKMLGLVMAFATKPDVLLLDEPAAGLERSERHRIDDFVRQVQNGTGRILLIVEHDMDLIRRLCPRIIVIDAGQVLAEGPPNEVLARRDVIDAYVGATEEASTP
jgi:branched-chain amino acid transport system ATP-binding protein